MLGRGMRLSGSTVAQREPAMRYAVTSSSAATCSRSGVTGSAGRVLACPPSWPAFARCTKDSTTGACATSLAAFPGSTWMRSKYSRHASATDCGFTRYFSYRSSMKLALAPYRYELSRNRRITVAMAYLLSIGLTSRLVGPW